jgi:hypothetical protein
MKKLLLVLAVAAFTACNSNKKEGEKTETSTETQTTPTEETTPAQDTTATVNPPATDGGEAKK